MAENESLDLRLPGGQRWIHVLDAVKKKQSPEEVAHKASRKLPSALRKAFKEFAELGVSFADFADNRHDAKALARLVRKCQGHEYAHLFAETAAADANLDSRHMLHSFLNGIVDRVADQITQDVAGSEKWPDFVSIHDLFSKVRICLEPDLQRIAKKLAADPTWSPTILRRKQTEEAINPTEELLSMSLLGITKR